MVCTSIDGTSETAKINLPGYKKQKYELTYDMSPMTVVKCYICKPVFVVLVT